MIFGKHINKYYLRYLPFFLVGVAALIVCDIFQLRLPEILGEIIDLLKQPTPVTKEQILPIIYRVLIIAAILFAGRVLWRLSLFSASRSIEKHIRKDMFDKALKLSTTYYKNNKVGNVMSWFTTDIETLEEYVGWGTLMMIDGLFLTGLTLFKMFKADWALSLITLLPIVLIALWGLLVEKFISLKWDLRQQSYDKLYDFTQESFTGIRVIKAFVKETQQIHAFAKIAKRDKEINVEFGKIAILFDVMIEIIVSLVFAIIMGFGSWFVWATITGNPVVIFGHQVTIQASRLVTFIFYFDTLIWPMIALGQVISMYSKAKTSFKRICHFLDSPEDLKNPENAISLNDCQGDIEFKNFCFTYPNTEREILKNISLKINKGELIGVVGRVGSGKSTLINSLLRLYNVKDETLFIDNKDIMSIDFHSVRENVAFVPQENFLFSEQISSNIAFSSEKVDQTKVEQSAKLASIYDDIVDFKDQFDTEVGERGTTLSGGQKQRISIARAFYKSTPILILDDSVSSVDVKTEEAILKSIKEERHGLTTIIVASRASTVSEADKIIVLNDGNLEAFDTPKNLLKISPTYKRMVELQKLEGYKG